jgi:hypothetical protein
MSCGLWFCIKTMIETVYIRENGHHIYLNPSGFKPEFKKKQQSKQVSKV